MSQDWQNILGRRLRKASRIVVLGVGSELKGDDAAGMLLIKKLQMARLPAEKILLLAGSTAPENFTGLICSFNPELLVVVDAAHLGGKPGDISIIEESQLKDEGFSTHMLPFSVMLQYLRKHSIRETILLGIQPRSMEFGFEPCSEVTETVEELAVFLSKTFKRSDDEKQLRSFS